MKLTMQGQGDGDDDNDNDKEVTYKYDNLWGETVNLGIPNISFDVNDDYEGCDDDDKAKKATTTRRRIELEDTMPNCFHGWITSSYQNKKLHYRKFLPTTSDWSISSSSPLPPKAIIVFHTGIQGHSGISFHLNRNDSSGDGNDSDESNSNIRKVGTALIIDKLVNEQQYGFYSLDQLGHGYSEGIRFYMPDYKHCVTDFITLMKLASKEYPNIPIFLMGISMGGNLAIHATVEIQKEQQQQQQTQSPASVVPNFAGLILLCAAIKGDLPPPPITYILRHILAPKYPTWKPFFMPNPVNSNRIWRDPIALQENTSPVYKSLGLGASGEPMMLGTALQCVMGIEDACNYSISKLQINQQTPLLAIHGIKDYAVPIESLDILESKLTNYNPNNSKKKKNSMDDTADTTTGSSVSDNDVDDDDEAVTIVRLPEAYHDLLCDPDSEYVVELITKFITKRITTTTTTATTAA